ncbi:MAG: histidine kinase [Ferruginibacter sp.]
MPAITIFILAVLFTLAFVTYFFLKNKLPGFSEWLKLNLILFVFGILAAAILTPFIIPHYFLRNLPVFTILPLLTYNIFYLVNEAAILLRIGKLIREIIDFASILAGIIIGSQIINLIGLSHFRFDDVKDAFLVAFFFNTARMLLNYASLLNKFIRRQKDLETVKVKQSNTQAQLDILQSKLNPHFLYNSLNSIAGLAMVDGKKTKDMTIALSKLLRYSLNYHEEGFVTIEEEMEIVRSYFDMEKIRFEDDLDYEMIVEPGLECYLVPKFILQPIAENCVKHAFTGQASNHFVQIKVTASNNQLSISIHDNGLPFPEKLVPGFGLKNVIDKLQLLLPGKHDFQIANMPEKEIRIIIHELKKKDGY